MFKLIETFEKYEPWDEARNTYYAICENNKLDALEELLEEMYPNGATEKAVNDLLSKNAAMILETLGIDCVTEELKETSMLGSLRQEEEINRWLEETNQEYDYHKAVEHLKEVTLYIDYACNPPHIYGLKKGN